MNPDQKNDDRRITYFAATHTRGKREMFGIRAVDRSKHVYVIGKTGMGKSTMLENMAIQDIQNGEGIVYIDPHGSTAEKLLDFIPHERIQDVVYFAPFDTEYPLGFNVMEDVGYDKRHLVVSGLMGAFKRIWVDAWSARMEYILQNTLLALLEYPGSTLLDVNRMLTNKNFRDAVVARITDTIVRAFWVEEFANFTDTYTREATPAIQNKIGQFVSNPLVRNIVGQPKSSFDLREVMDNKKLFIVNLSKGRMGESNASLLGSMLTVKVYLAAMSRADEPPTRMARLPRCFFYVDEFQSMMNEAFADILSESRKYKLALTLANQYIEQMEETVRDAVFGNVGTLITFRVGPFDAETLKTVFEPTFEAEDLVGLGIGQIYLTLMIDGVGSAPFSAETIPPIDAPSISYREDVVVRSRAVYARPKAEVEKVIGARQEEFPAPAPKPKKEGGFKPAGGQGGFGGGNGQASAPRREPAPILTPAQIMRAGGTTSDTPRPALAQEHPHAQPERQFANTPQQGSVLSPLGFTPRPREERPMVSSMRSASEKSLLKSPIQSPQHNQNDETAQRDALRKAIQGARALATPPRPAPTVPPQRENKKEELIRSPLEILRAKTPQPVVATPVAVKPILVAAPRQAGQETRQEPRQEPRQESRYESREPRRENHRREHHHAHQSYAERQERTQEARGQQSHYQGRHDTQAQDSGEVSHELLRRILHPSNREADE